MNIGKKQLNEIEFGVLWSSVEHELYKLFYNNKCSALVVYNNIYIVCTDPQNKFVETLYWKLGDFIYERAREIRTSIFKEEDWVPEYNKGFRRYREYVSCLNELCDFLSQYISAKSLDIFAFILWERCVLQTAQKFKGTTLGLCLVNNCKLEHVKSAIESLKCIVIDNRNPLLYYVQSYEQYALEKIKTKFELEVASLDFLKKKEISDESPFQETSIPAYSKYVYETVEQQRKHREKILLEESFENLDLILQDILVTQRKKFIQNEVYRLLGNHKLPVEILDMIRDSGSKSEGCRGEEHTFASGIHPINDFYALYNKTNLKKTYTLSSDVLKTVAQVFNYLKPVKHSYNIMRNALVKYITSQLETYSHLLDRRIETLYVFYCMFRNVVEIGFNSDQGCFEVFEKKFSEVLSSLRPSLTSRLIEFSSSIVANDNHLFEFLDDKKVVEKLKEFNLDMCREERGDFLRRNRSLTDLTKVGKDDAKKESTKKEGLKGSKTLTPGEISKTFREFKNKSYREGALFRVFYHLYSLIEDTNDFSERYTFELARRLVTGTTDYQKEQNLIQIIKSHSSSDSIRKSEIMLADVKNQNSTLLLTQCAWPLEHIHIEIKLPAFFTNLIREEEARHFKKKFSWLWEYSTIYLEIDNTEIRVNMLQYIVLDLFNIQNSFTKEEIVKKTNLKGKNLEWVLSSLVRSNILSIQHGVISLGTLPYKHNPYDYYIKENLSQDHEINRMAYYQSVACKIMKEKKEMTLSNLLREVALCHTDSFTMDKAEFNKGIKGLLEKGILEEISPGLKGSSTTTGMYLKYIP